MTDSRRGPKSGDYIEKIGFHSTLSKETVIDSDRALYWISKGAQTSGTVHNLLVSKGIIKSTKKNVLPKKTPLVKKEDTEPVDSPPVDTKEDAIKEDATKEDTTREDATKETTTNDTPPLRPEEKEPRDEMRKKEGDEKEEGVAPSPSSPPLKTKEESSTTEEEK